MTGNEMLQPILVSDGDHMNIRELIVKIILTWYDIIVLQSSMMMVLVLLIMVISTSVPMMMRLNLTLLLWCCPLMIPM